MIHDVENKNKKFKWSTVQEAKYDVRKKFSLEIIFTFFFLITLKLFKYVALK